MAYTADNIIAALSYDRATGDLRWRARDRSQFDSDRTFKFWNSKYSGKLALTAIGSGGYRAGKLNGKYISAHRAAYAIVEGVLPDSDIDHIDGDRANNAWSNLRCVSRSANCSNRRMHKNNTSGEVGVTFDKKSGKWRARVRDTVIGFFDDFADAATARRLAAAIEGGFTNRHGSLGA